MAALVADDLRPTRAGLQPGGLARQDCIAVYLPELGIGHLIGPRADTWGAFNLDYFVRH